MSVAGYCGAMGWSGWLMMAGFWIGFLALVVWGVTRLFPSARSPESRGDAYELLARRLARGEIDAESYRQARDALAAGR